MTVSKRKTLHSKDPLYKKTALKGFQFSARNFSQPK